MRVRASWSLIRSSKLPYCVIMYIPEVFIDGEGLTDDCWGEQVIENLIQTLPVPVSCDRSGFLGLGRPY